MKTFNSKYWCPGTSGVYAFAFNWHSDNNWLVPPISLVSKVLTHLRHSCAKGVLIIPKWESSFFWPSLVDVQTGTYKNFISEVVEYSNPSNFFVAGSQQNSIFATTPFPTKVVVAKLDGSLW